MSEHAWVLKNMASCLAGGLEPRERERLEQHIASCPECAKAWEHSRTFEEQLHELFDGVQPDPALEDRVIQSLRVSARPRKSRGALSRFLPAAAAAVLLVGFLGGVGAFVGDVVEQGRLTYPWEAARAQQVVAVDVPPKVTGGTDLVLSVSPPEEGLLLDVNGLAVEAREKALEELQTESAWMVQSARFEDTGNWESPAVDFDGDGLVADYLWIDASPQTPVVTGGIAVNPQDQAGETVTFALDDNANKRGEAAAGVPALGLGTNVNFYSYRNEIAKSPTPVTGGDVAGGEAVAKVAVNGLHFKPTEVFLATPAVTTPSTASRSKDTTIAVGTVASADDAITAAAPQQNAGRRKVIRSGEMEFEVDSFDTAVERITEATVEEGGFVATVDSEKLPNGKMQGSVVVRVVPDRLDKLVLKLRALGELKSQQIGSQDITRQYTDLESRLRAARAMEERLLEMIRDGQGEIEHLLKAEKELGTWRTKIEEIEGELRYFNNVVALSTLRIALVEKEIRAAASLTETEQVEMGIEVEDVEQAHQEALTAIQDAGGQITKSELKQHAAEQYSAVVNFQVPRDAAGPLRDRLKQIGRVVRLQIDRVQEADSATELPREARTIRRDTVFAVSLYNVANVAPRETVHVHLACTDAESAYKELVEQVRQAGGRIVNSSLKDEQSHKTMGTVRFELPVAAADAVLLAVKTAGEVMRLEVTENPDSENVTTSKRGFNVELWALGLVAPRETIVVQVATDDVPAAFNALQESVTAATGRILTAELNEQDRQNITARLDFDVPRDGRPVLEQLGEVISRTVKRSTDDKNVIDSKVRVQVALIDQARIPPRETITLGIEVSDVGQASAALSSLVAEARGRTVESHLAQETNGRVTARLVFDVPLASAGGLVEGFKASGTVRAQQSARNPQVPDGELAIARLQVTLSNAELIVPSDGGLMARIRTGLSTSFAAISWSLVVVIVGLCFVLPWALVLYLVYRVVGRFRRRNATAKPAA